MAVVIVSLDNCCLNDVITLMVSISLLSLRHLNSNEVVDNTEQFSVILLPVMANWAAGSSINRGVVVSSKSGKRMRNKMKTFGKPDF